MTRKIVTTLVLIAAFSLTAIAQQPVPTQVITPACAFGANADGSCKPEQAAPTLTEEQKLQLQLAAVTMENWQLKAQQAAAEFQKAQTTFQQMIAAVTPPGYVLNGNLEFQKVEAPKKEPGPQ